jgi:hypothetical protein
MDSIMSFDGVLMCVYLCGGFSIVMWGKLSLNSIGFYLVSLLIALMEFQFKELSTTFRYWGFNDIHYIRMTLTLLFKVHFYRFQGIQNSSCKFTGRGRAFEVSSEGFPKISYFLWRYYPSARTLYVAVERRLA